jgi:hypothetical protein
MVGFLPISSTFPDSVPACLDSENTTTANPDLPSGTCAGFLCFTFFTL